MSLIEILVSFKNKDECDHIQDRYPDFRNFYWHSGAVGTLGIGILNFELYKKLQKRLVLAPLNYLADLITDTDPSDIIMIDCEHIPETHMSDLVKSIETFGMWLYNIGYIPHSFVLEVFTTEILIRTHLDPNRYSDQLSFIIYVLNSVPVIIDGGCKTLCCYFIEE